MATREERAMLARNIMQGKEEENAGFHSVNEVRTVPEGFKKWVDRNNDRIMKAKALPYFLRDNGRIVGGKWVLGKTDVKPSGTVVKSAELGKGTIVPSAKVQDALVPRCEAKTAQEAADYIKTYIADDVAMPINKGDLPLLNEYLTHVSQRMKEFGMERFSVVGVPESRKAMASFSRQNNSYNLNMSALRNYKKQWEGEMKWRKKGIPIWHLKVKRML